MSIFNQSDNLDRCPITAAVIQDVIKENKDNLPTCPITEQQLEERVSDILHCIYYSIKSGECEVGFIWTFSLNVFGITGSISEHTHIKDYLWNRFVEAGFEVSFGETTIVISIPYEYKVEWPKAQQVFVQSIAYDLVPVIPTPHFKPLMFS